MSCSDHFYFSEWHWRESGNVALIYEGDLATGSIRKQLEVPGVVDALALSCHTGEVC